MNSQRLATLLAFAALVAAQGCRSRGRAGESDLRLAAVASESLTTALADSVAPLNGFALAGEGVDFLSACDNRVDATGWQSYASPVLELELPAGFSQVESTADGAAWRSADGFLTARASSPSGRGQYRRDDGTECDVYIGGWPAHVELTSNGYGKGIRASIETPGDYHIAVEAQAKTTSRQAQLLRAIRTARISSSWGARR